VHCRVSMTALGITVWAMPCHGHVVATNHVRAGENGPDASRRGTKACVDMLECGSSDVPRVNVRHAAPGPSRIDTVDQDDRVSRTVCGVCDGRADFVATQNYDGRSVVSVLGISHGHSLCVDSSVGDPRYSLMTRMELQAPRRIEQRCLRNERVRPLDQCRGQRDRGSQAPSAVRRAARLPRRPAGTCRSRKSGPRGTS
jgi:hypothetical protein